MFLKIKSQKRDIDENSEKTWSCRIAERDS